jgi:hypothetical protein
MILYLHIKLQPTVKLSFKALTRTILHLHI